MDDPASGLVVGSVVPLGAVVGGPEPDTIRATLADLPADFEVIVQEDAIEVARIALPQWRSVWGADERNKASLRLAASLGFRTVDRLWVLAAE